MAKKAKMSQKAQIAELKKELEEAKESISTEVKRHGETFKTAFKLRAEVDSLQANVEKLESKLKKLSEENARLHKVAHHSLGLLHAVIDNADD